MPNPTFAICIPMANEEDSFRSFIDSLTSVIDEYPGASVYLVVDKASTDATPELCRQLQERDSRYHYVWAPENKNVVDAYLRGFREAMKAAIEYPPLGSNISPSFTSPGSTSPGFFPARWLTTFDFSEARLNFLIRSYSPPFSKIPSVRASDS